MNKEPIKPPSDPDMHRGELVRDILYDRSQGLTQRDLQDKYRVSLNFISNILHDRPNICSHCGKKFFTSGNQKSFGSLACFHDAILAMSRPSDAPHE